MIEQLGLASVNLGVGDRKRRRGWATGLALLGATALGGPACGSRDANGTPPIGMSATDGPTTMTASMSGTDTDSGTDSMTATDTDTDGTGPTGTGELPANCGELNCSDNGSCLVDAMGVPYCECDPGYIIDEDQDTCIIDESCVQVRFLEDRCRQRINGAPAVALFFGVDFCAGPAVTPEKLTELGLSFKVLENDEDIAENVESEATIIDKNVENYVMLVLDVSDSLTQSEDLGDLVTEVRALVQTLQPEAGQSDVYVGVTVFARQVAEYVPFTTDLAAVDTALASLGSDPAPIVELAGDGAGTRLFEATKEGIENTQRIRDLRDAVTWGGVLSTGTVVVITDGKDSSNADLDQVLIDDTLNQVISIGVSTDIDDEQLAAVGRDGSFLAPSPSQWSTAFAEIATRVEEYPERSYLLAYCSSTTDGTPEVKVSIDGSGLTSVTEAACIFNAELFSSQAFECNADLFRNECNAQLCGGLTGCGACSDDQCCNGDGTCGAPQSSNQLGTDCTGQGELCGPESLVCWEQSCVDPLDVDDGCGGPDAGSDCARKEAYCTDPVEGGVCLAALPLGSPCDFPAQCESLNCYFPNPENPFEGRRCLPEARIFDHCGPDDGDCEMGGYCQGSVCAPRRRELVSCAGNDQCRQANCATFDSGNFCAGPAGCYWAWDEKVPN